MVAHQNARTPAATTATATPRAGRSLSDRPHAFAAAVVSAPGSKATLHGKRKRANVSGTGVVWSMAARRCIQNAVLPQPAYLSRRKLLYATRSSSLATRDGRPTKLPLVVGGVGVVSHFFGDQIVKPHSLSSWQQLDDTATAVNSALCATHSSLGSVVRPRKGRSSKQPWRRSSAAHA